LEEVKLAQVTASYFLVAQVGRVKVRLEEVKLAQVTARLLGPGMLHYSEGEPRTVYRGRMESRNFIFVCTHSSTTILLFHPPVIQIAGLV
jgi:hypothetical protein